MMARVSTYLNFSRKTEEAFNFYKTVFGTEFVSGISRMGDRPQGAGKSKLAEEDKNLIMHIALPTIGDHILMGTDVLESFGSTFKAGNSMYINLEPDTYLEAEKLYLALSEGGKIEMTLRKMYWGDYYAAFIDKFGISWMINSPAEA
ncbi:MAG: VOC family protein [Clostridia bacterium]